MILNDRVNPLKGANKNSKTEDFENSYVLFLSVYVRRNTGDTLITTLQPETMLAPYL